MRTISINHTSWAPIFHLLSTLRVSLFDLNMSTFAGVSIAPNWIFPLLGSARPLVQSRMFRWYTSGIDLGETRGRGH